MDTLTSRLLSSTNFWSMWKMVGAAGMWSEMSHKSCFISSVVVAEKDELLFFHLIHMSICLLSVPLSKDYWCPVFDIWHITQSSFSSCELTRRGREKKCKPDCHQPGGLSHCSFVLRWPPSRPVLPLLTWSFSTFLPPDPPPLPSPSRRRGGEQRASWVAKFGGKLFIWPLHVSAFYNLVCVTPVSSP